MTTRSSTQRVAAGLLTGSRARWATSGKHHPLGHLDVQPSPAGSPRRCPAAPTTDPASMRHPTSGRRRSRPHRPGRPRPAPGSLPGVDATSRASAARSTWSAPEVVDHLGDPSSPSAGVLPSRIRRKLTRPGQPIAMRNSSTSAIGRTAGRRPSISAPSSPRSTRSSCPRRRPAAVHARRGTRRATSNACKDGARLGLCTSATAARRERDRVNKRALVESEISVGRMRWRPSRVGPQQAELRARRSEWCSLSPGVY